MPGEGDEAACTAESAGLQRGQRGLCGAPPVPGDDDTNDDDDDDDSNDDNDDYASLPGSSTRWAAPW